MSKDEDLMRPEAEIQKGASKMRLVLAPGAADASEGTVWVEVEDRCQKSEVRSHRSEDERKECWVLGFVLEGKDVSRKGAKAVHRLRRLTQINGLTQRR